MAEDRIVFDDSTRKVKTFCTCITVFSRGHIIFCVIQSKYTQWSIYLVRMCEISQFASSYIKFPINSGISTIQRCLIFLGEKWYSTIFLFLFVVHVEQIECLSCCYSSILTRASVHWCPLDSWRLRPKRRQTLLFPARETDRQQWKH